MGRVKTKEGVARSAQAARQGPNGALAFGTWKSWCSARVMAVGWCAQREWMRSVEAGRLA